MSPVERLAHGARGIRILGVAALLAGAPTAPAAVGAQVEEAVSLTLEEAIARALERNEEIFIERRSVDAAEAAVLGADGAYDPLLAVESGWRRVSAPVASAFSGAPPGALAPTDEVVEAGAVVRQLLPTGGEVTLRASSARGETDGAFELLSPTYDSRLGAELRQPLLRDRRVDAARLRIRVADADHERAFAALRREVIETVAETEQAYWTLAAARRGIEVRQEAVELAAEQLEETRIRIESGVAPETELAQPRAELERRRGELLEAEEAVARAENDLKLLILGDADADLWSERLAPAEGAAVEPAPLDVAAAMDEALASRAELAAAAAFVERRRAESAFARDGIRPALDLVLAYDRFGLAGSANPAAAGLPGLPTEVPPGLEGGFGDAVSALAEGEFEDARAALVLEVPIGNRSARAAAAVAASQVSQAEAELARFRKVVRAEVLDAAAALEVADGRIEAARAAREAAEVQLAAERERFDVGLSTNFLVLTRQNDLARARIEEIEAQTDYRTARAELGRVTGSLLDERGIELQVDVPED